VSEPRTPDIPVGGWDPDNALAHARAQALAELEPLKEELRERARRIAEREAELRPAAPTPDEALARRARELAAAEQAALEAVDARARALDARAKELVMLARELEARAAAAGAGLPTIDRDSEPGFVGFSEGFEAFAESRRQRRAPAR
jgi:hypothetical protein